MSAVTARDRIVEAAFALYDERGFAATTVEAIAERAGVGRSTFFRAFASKEDVIFPDHADLQARIEARLAAAADDAGIQAVVEAARLVLEHFLAEGDLARSRYRLTRTVPALRDREIAGAHGYQKVFRDFIRTSISTGSGADAELGAELMANAVVTAHNVVLRRWLRGLTSEPLADFDTAIGQVVDLFGQPAADETTVVVLRSTRSVESLVPALRRALADGPRGDQEDGRG